MSTLRIVHISPPLKLVTFIAEVREAEFHRIFGEDIEVVHVSHLGKTPKELAQTLRDISPDAVVLAAAPPDHHQAVMHLANETLILHPVTQRYRDHHGYARERTAGFGVMREHGPELAADGALADRSAIAQELTIQRDLQQETRERPPNERER